jgi:hypothetical protein
VPGKANYVFEENNLPKYLRWKYCKTRPEHMCAWQGKLCLLKKNNLSKYFRWKKDQTRTHVPCRANYVF